MSENKSNLFNDFFIVNDGNSKIQRNNIESLNQDCSVRIHNNLNFIEFEKSDYKSSKITKDIKSKCDTFNKKNEYENILQFHLVEDQNSFGSEKYYIDLYYKLGDLAISSHKNYEMALYFYIKAYENDYSKSYKFPIFKYARTLMYYFEDHIVHGEDIENKICECLKYSIILNMEALNKDKNDCIALFNIACILGMFNIKESLDFFIKALENADEQMKDNIYKEMTEINLNEYYDLQLIYIDKAIEYDFSNAYYYSQKGTILSHFKQYDEAIDLQLLSIKLNESESLFYYRLGNLYKLKGNVKNAIDYFNKAIKLNSGIDYYYYDLGKLLFDIKSYKEALELFKKVLEISYNSECMMMINECNFMLESKDQKNKSKMFKIIEMFKIEKLSDVIKSRLDDILQKVKQNNFSINTEESIINENILDVRNYDILLKKAYSYFF